MATDADNPPLHEEVFLAPLWCNLCFDQLDEPGALIFGPPDPDSVVKKWHICALCYDTTILSMLADLPTPEPIPPGPRCGVPGCLLAMGHSGDHISRPLTS